MTSDPFSELFLAIMAIIKDKVPAIRHIDQDLGQLDFYKETPSVSWPCVLIDVDEFDFDNMSENTQAAKGTIIIRLGFQPYSSSSNITPDIYRRKALEYYNLEWQIHKALHGWSPGDDFGSLCRTSCNTERREDPIRVRTSKYSIAFEDYDTKTPDQTAPATFQLGT